MSLNQEKITKTNENQQKKMSEDTKKEKETEAAALVMIYSEMNQTSPSEQEIADEERKSETKCSMKRPKAKERRNWRGL